jgi:hypothetical protein
MQQSAYVIAWRSIGNLYFILPRIIQGFEEFRFVVSQSIVLQRVHDEHPAVVVTHVCTVHQAAPRAMCSMSLKSDSEQQSVAC